MLEGSVYLEERDEVGHVARVVELLVQGVFYIILQIEGVQLWLSIVAWNDV